MVWLAGQVADDATLDAEGQTADILRQVDALLAEAGTDKRALVSMHRRAGRHPRRGGDEPRLGRLAGPARTSRRA